MNKSLHVYAPLRNFTGYAEVVRNLIWRLYTRGWDIHFEEFKGWAPVTVPLKPEVEKIFSHFEQNKIQAGRKLHICLPEQCRLEESKININLTMFEASRALPTLWVESSRKCDKVIVPTVHNSRLWKENLGFPFEKVYRVPFGIDPAEIKKAGKFPVFEQDEGVSLQDNYHYQILVLQEFISRKNLTGVLRAFYLGCVKNPQRSTDTCLVLKINSNSGNKLAQFKKVQESVKHDIEEEYKVELERNVFVYTKTLDDDYMCTFFNSFTHYFSMSWGEGWDLNCIKAAALGKQIIVPASTSYLEYLDDNSAHLIPVKEQKCKILEPNLIRIYAESFWTVPDVEAASDYISRLDKLETKNDSERILNEYTWDKSADILNDTLEQFDLEPSKTLNRSYAVKQTPMMICKTLGTKCGIGEYTKTLHQMSGDIPLITVAGDPYLYLAKIDKYRPNLVHIQNEYQFSPLERMKFFMNQLQAAGIKTVLTQHTFNENVYTYNRFFAERFDSIIVHNQNIKSEYQKQVGLLAQKVQYFPMPVSRFTVSDKEMDKVQLGYQSDVFKIGFFGFCYFHKGISRLLTIARNILMKSSTTDRERFKLYIFATKPVQDHQNYFEQCVKLIEVYGLEKYVVWNTEYLPIETLVANLKCLDIISLPYDDYGSLGSSAALSTCIQAEKPVILCSEESPYFDVDDEYIPNIFTVSNRQLEEELTRRFNDFLDGKKEVSNPEVWDKIFDERSWKRFVDFTQDIYKKVVHA